MLSKTQSISRPWQLISADLVGPLPRSSSGYAYILSVCDCFSKFVLLFPLRTPNATQVARVIEDQVILVYGAPNRIIVDNGVQFKSRQFREKVAEYKVTVAFTANYHPQANPVERVHRVIKTMLVAYVKDRHNTWDKYLAKVAWAIRSAKHDVTGQTPNLINFGRELTISGDEHPIGNEMISFERCQESIEKNRALKNMYDDVKKRLAAAYEKSRRIYNLRRRDETFSAGQQVWRRNFTVSDAARQFTAKLAPRYLGPYVIKRNISPWTYELKDELGSSKGVWHAKDLKAHPPDEPFDQ
nr:unnamed protein product [Callosobruchus analis]